MIRGVSGPKTAGGIPRPLVPSIVLTLLLFTAAETGVHAQTSAHERVGVQSIKSMELTISAAVDAAAAETAKAKGVSLQTSLSADFLISEKWNISATFPYGIIAETGPENRFPLIGAHGDPEVSLGFTTRIGGWRLGTDLAWSHPSGVSDAVRAEVLGFSSGSGSGALSLLVRANRFLDPLSVGTNLILTCALPPRERFGSESATWSAKAGVSLTEALNRYSLLGLSLTQSLALPSDMAGVPGFGSFRYSAIAGANLTLTNGSTSLRLGASANLADPSVPGSVHAIVSKSIDIGRKP